ncbi:hypothetical protein [Propionivibrio sp.]|uniref:hypothetical protein n=1 Tax=Propionivibrio sp. TaxID=2212460 RepID=UPI003BF08B37
MVIFIAAHNAVGLGLLAKLAGGNRPQAAVEASENRCASTAGNSSDTGRSTLLAVSPLLGLCRIPEPDRVGQQSVGFLSFGTKS